MKQMFFGRRFFTSLVGETEVCNGKFVLFMTDNKLSFGKSIAGGTMGMFVLEVLAGVETTKPDPQNVLISFPIPSFSNVEHETGFQIDVTGAGLTATLGICPVNVFASNTGVATWFRYYNTRNPDSMITGTVGSNGSGAELIISDVTIFKDVAYKSFGFKFHLPSKIRVAGT